MRPLMAPLLFFGLDWLASGSVLLFWKEFGHSWEVTYWTHRQLGKACRSSWYDNVEITSWVLLVRLLRQ